MREKLRPLTPGPEPVEGSKGEGAAVAGFRAAGYYALMAMDCLDEIPGAAEFRSWFGGLPSFHDANVLDFHVGLNGPGRLGPKAFRMTDKADGKGFFMNEKHVAVTILPETIGFMEIGDFMHGAGVFGSEIRRTDDGFGLPIDSSYGFPGSVRVGRIAIGCDSGKAT